MNYLELVNEVLSELDAPGVTTLVGASGITKRAMGWINQVIFDIYSRSNDWSFREASTTLSTIAATAAYNLPSTVDTDSIKSLTRQNGQTPLQYIDYETWEELAAHSGIPNAFTLFQNQLFLYPIPDSAYTLTYRYQRNPVRLVNDTDTPAIFDKWHYVIVHGAAYKAKLFLNDEDQQDQRVIYEQGVKKMLNHNRDMLGRVTGMNPENPFQSDR